MQQFAPPSKPSLQHDAIHYKNPIKKNNTKSFSPIRLKFIKIAIATSALTLTPLRNSLAEVIIDSDGRGYHWVHTDNFTSKDQAHARCKQFEEKYRDPPDANDYCYWSGNGEVGLYYFSGWWQNKTTGVFHSANYYVNKCTTPSVYNVSTAQCGNDEQKGAPPAYSCAGNPINIAVGNKFQVESDFASAPDSNLTFNRYYNSLDGIWRHSYSTFLRFAVGKLSLVRADGRETFFTVDGDTVSADPTETGILSKSGDIWTYTTDTNERFIFDKDGRLTSQIDSTGRGRQLVYVNDAVTVTSDTGQTLTFKEDASHQPLSLTVGPLQITYSYNSNNRLSQFTRTQGGTSLQRLYHYEDTRNPSLLTGITDERGVRMATWAYDAQGRAISSEHSGGTERTLVSYNPDGSSTVTNELGKNTIYRFANFAGVKRVTAIEGEPSSNCAASNSSYTYNDRGLTLGKTDAKGSITTYTYNDRGLETSRTEASGTPLARTTTTEWDPVRYLKTKVVEPTRTTIYTYDAQGRTVSQQTSPN